MVIKLTLILGCLTITSGFHLFSHRPSRPPPTSRGKLYPFLTIYDHIGEKGDEAGNVISRAEFSKNYLPYHRYNFKNFTQGYHNYDRAPVLLVLQPNEKENELHGFYLPRGMTSFIPTSKGSVPLYEPLLDYLDKHEPYVDGLTPAAAKFGYPQIYNSMLTDIAHIEELAPWFSVLFVAPKQNRPENFTENFYKKEDYRLDERNRIQKINLDLY